MPDSPTNQTIDFHLRTAGEQLSRTCTRVTEQGLGIGDLGTAIGYLVALAEHGAEFASIVGDVMDDAPPDHALASVEGIVTRLAIGHMGGVIDGAVTLGSYAKRDIEQLTRKESAR